MRACLRKKRQAQRELYDRFSYQMRGVALRYSEDSDEANDILQEAFITVFDQLKNYTEQGSLGGWIHRITVNTALQHYRKKQTRNTHHGDFGLEAETFTDNEIFETLSLEALLEKIQRLPEGFRMVFNLRAIEGFSHKEIAEMLGISEGTSKSQYARAKKHLQQTILAERESEQKRIHGS